MVLWDSHAFLADHKRGISYQHLGEYEKALSDFNTAIEICGVFPDAYYSRGVLYQMLDKHELAREDFKKALEIDGKHVPARQMLEGRKNRPEEGRGTGRVK